MTRPIGSGRVTRWIRVAETASLPLAVALGLLLLPRSSPGAQGRGIDFGVGISSTYDDNLIQYSDDQLVLFESGTKPDQFSIHSSDDVAWRPYVSLAWSEHMGRGRSRTIRVRGGGEFHSENHTADTRSISGSWAEALSRDSQAMLTVYRLPRFYLRQLLDDDVVPPFPGLSRYRRAQFGLTIGSASWRQRLAGRVRARLYYQYEHRGYNPDFVERTSATHQGDLELERYRLPNRGVVSIHGGYRWSKAKGEDGDDAGRAVPDDPDVSYHGVVAGTGGSMDLVRRKRWVLSAELGYEMGTRAYDSDRPADKYHNGRKDVSHMAEAAFRITYAQHWVIRGVYQFDHNSANLGATVPPSSDVGSYTENQVGLALAFSGALWRKSSVPADRGEE